MENKNNKIIIKNGLFGPAKIKIELDDIEGLEIMIKSSLGKKELLIDIKEIYGIYHYKLGNHNFWYEKLKENDKKYTLYFKYRYDSSSPCITEFEFITNRKIYKISAKYNKKDHHSGQIKIKNYNEVFIHKDDLRGLKDYFKKQFIIV
jgi:hypothetical protein